MMNNLKRLLFCFVGLVVTACVGYSGVMDGLGRESAVTETAHNKEQIADDRIEDKHPEYDPSRTVDEAFGGECVVRLNKSGAVTKLDIVKPSGGDADLSEKIFSSRKAAANHVKGRLDSETSLLPSIEVVNGAMKPFNDGLYAAVEIGVQEGLPLGGDAVYPSKRQFLEALLSQVLAMGARTDVGEACFDDAAADLAAALIVGGASPEVPTDIRAEAGRRAEMFTLNPIVSAPIGFYTWTAELEQIFGQDRYLQNYQGESDPYTTAEIGKAAALALAIDSDATLKARYEGYLALFAGLTNPFMNYPVTALLPYLDEGEASLERLLAVGDAFLTDNPPPALSPSCQPRFALFPSSMTKETAFFESEYCTGDAPANIDYMETLIAAIRDGRVDLTPSVTSGWYDYQSHALEVLLLPERGDESDHLLLTKAYKEKLVESFKSIMTQNRETHVKQVEMGTSDKGAGSLPVDIYPNFPVEPFPTFYLRSARAYRFVRSYLTTVLGDGFLSSTARLIEDGTVSEMSLDEELGQKAALLYGLHLLTADAVGMAPALLAEELAEFDEAACRDMARAWTSQWLEDADVARDSRVMVPVQREPDVGVVVYWVTLGTRIVKASAEFVEGYAPEVVYVSDAEMPSYFEAEQRWYCDAGEMVPHMYYLLVDTFAEVRLDEDTPPPNRETLRAILDRYDTAGEMVAALESL